MATAAMALPEGITPEQTIKALHNHDLMIKSICPQLISYNLESGDATSVAVYSVTDKKPIGTTTYKLTLTNQADGLDSLVNAKPPIGALNIASKWRIVDGKLDEEADIDGNMITKKMGKDTVTKEHPKAMEMILAEAAKV